SGTVQVNAASVEKDASVLSDDLKEIEGEISLHELKGCNGMLMMKNIASRRQTSANADGSETDVAEEIKLIATADLKHDQYLLGDSWMNPDIILSSESKFDSVPKRGRPKKHSSKPLLKSKQKSTLSDTNEHALPISQSMEFPNTPSSGKLSEQLQEDCVEVPTDESHSQIPIAKAVNQIIEPLCTVTELSSGEPMQREECNPLNLTQPLVSHSCHEMLPIKIKIRKPTCKPQSVMASTDMKTQARSAYLATCISYFQEKHNTALRVVKTKPNSPSNEACFLPISVGESKEQFTKPARTLKKKVDDKELQTANACSSFSSQLPLSLPIKPLYIRQAHKQPRANQPVVVLNHPYMDPQEVVNLMRTVNMYPGCIIKVVLSRRTLAAMEASNQEQQLLKQVNRHKMLEQRRGILKMKLRRMSSNSYQVVHTAVHARTCTSQKTRFSCWFCGRVFSGQEEWVSHGQRHLSEATRNWGTIFPSAIAKAAFSTTLTV
ncbi:unnamed protein product, partial [Lampetra fluviatilis]